MADNMTALNTSKFLLIGKTNEKDSTGRNVYEEIEEAREIPGKGCFVRHTVRETLPDRSSSKIVNQCYVPGVTIICVGVSGDGSGNIQFSLQLVDSGSKEAKEAKPLDWFVSQLDKKEEQKPPSAMAEPEKEEQKPANTNNAKGK